MFDDLESDLADLDRLRQNTKKIQIYDFDPSLKSFEEIAEDDQEESALNSPKANPHQKPSPAIQTTFDFNKEKKAANDPSVEAKAEASKLPEPLQRDQRGGRDPKAEGVEAGKEVRAGDGGGKKIRPPLRQGMDVGGRAEGGGEKGEDRAEEGRGKRVGGEDGKGEAGATGEGPRVGEGLGREGQKGPGHTLKEHMGPDKGFEPRKQDRNEETKSKLKNAGDMKTEGAEMKSKKNENETKTKEANEDRHKNHMNLRREGQEEGPETIKQKRNESSEKTMERWKELSQDELLNEMFSIFRENIHLRELLEDKNDKVNTYIYRLKNLEETLRQKDHQIEQLKTTLELQTLDHRSKSSRFESETLRLVEKETEDKVHDLVGYTDRRIGELAALAEGRQAELRGSLELMVGGFVEEARDGMRRVEGGLDAEEGDRPEEHREAFSELYYEMMRKVEVTGVQENLEELLYRVRQEVMASNDFGFYDQDIEQILYEQKEQGPRRKTIVEKLTFSDQLISSKEKESESNSSSKSHTYASQHRPTKPSFQPEANTPTANIYNHHHQPYLKQPANNGDAAEFAQFRQNYLGSSKLSRTFEGSKTLRDPSSNEYAAGDKGFFTPASTHQPHAHLQYQDNEQSSLYIGNNFKKGAAKYQDSFDNREADTYESRPNQQPEDQADMIEDNTDNMTVRSFTSRASKKSRRDIFKKIEKKKQEQQEQREEMQSLQSEQDETRDPRTRFKDYQHDASSKGLRGAKSNLNLLQKVTKKDEEFINGTRDERERREQLLNERFENYAEAKWLEGERGQTGMDLNTTKNAYLDTPKTDTRIEFESHSVKNHSSTSSVKGPSQAGKKLPKKLIDIKTGFPGV
jgi:hypothetical protein